jgi:pimeloyl-ACP methyl ester carboxylesterase
VRTLSLASLVSLATLGGGSAMAQSDDGERPEVDNYAQIPGIEETPLGTFASVDVRGTGETNLILIHDPDWDARVWEPFVERNEDSYTMYVVTVPGSAGTPMYPIPEYDEFETTPWLDSLAEATVNLIDDEGIDSPYIMVFRDIATHVALSVAKDHPEKIAGVVTVSGGPRVWFNGFPPLPETPEDDAERLAYAQKNYYPLARRFPPENWVQGGFQQWQFGMTPEEVEWSSEIFRNRTAVASIRFIMESFTTNSKPWLEDLEVPVLAAIGEYDFESLMDNLAELSTDEGGDVVETRQALLGQMEGAWGGPDGAKKTLIRQIRRSTTEWDEIDGALDSVVVKRFDKTRVFIMNDRPVAFDEALASFTSMR